MRDPAFLFYSKDWLSGTADLHPAEKGVYIDLLAHQHQRGTLPTEMDRLARLVGLTVNEFEQIWKVVGKKFERTDNQTVNRKLEQVVNKRSEKAKKNRIIGTFAALIRTKNLTKKQISLLKNEFNVSEFMHYDCNTDYITERLSEWMVKRLKSIGNANININKGGMGGKFIKPSVQQIKDFCKERKNGIDAEHFFNYYEARAWMYGNSHIKDWKAAIITWEKHKNNKIPIGSGVESKSIPVPRDVSEVI